MKKISSCHWPDRYMSLENEAYSKVTIQEIKVDTNDVFGLNKIDKGLSYHIITDKINKIDFNYTHLLIKSFAAIARIFQTNKFITQVSFSGGQISGIDLTLAKEILSQTDQNGQNNCAVTHLDLRSNNIDWQGIKLLREGFNKNYSVTHLNLSDNKITPTAFAFIAIILKKADCPITELVLESCGLGNSYDHYLLALWWKKSQAHLETSKETQMFKSLQSALQTNKSLIDLDLKNNNIGPIGAARLAHGIENNKILVRLNLSDNSVGDKGLQYISSALAKNECALKFLYLLNNNITGRGVEYFARALDSAFAVDSALAKGTPSERITVNNVLERVFFDDQKAYQGGSAILKMLDSNNTIECLIFPNYNPAYFNQETAQLNNAIKLKIVRNFLKSKTTAFLDLSHNVVEDQILQYLSEFITQNKFLRYIDLRDNSFSGEAVILLIKQLIADKSTVEAIDISYNDLGEYCQKIMQLLKDTGSSLTVNFSTETYKWLYSRLTDKELMNLTIDQQHSNQAEILESLHQKILVKTDLHWNIERDGGILALKGVLQKNTQILNLELSKQGIDKAAFVELIDLLEYMQKNNSALVNLNLQNCTIDNNTAYLIIKKACLIKSLKFVDLSKNNIDDNGARQIIGLIKENTITLKLDLRNNDIHDGLFNHAQQLIAFNNKEFEKNKADYIMLKSKLDQITEKTPHNKTDHMDIRSMAQDFSRKQIQYSSHQEQSSNYLDLYSSAQLDLYIENELMGLKANYQDNHQYDYSFF